MKKKLVSAILVMLGVAVTACSPPVTPPLEERARIGTSFCRQVHDGDLLISPSCRLLFVMKKPADCSLIREDPMIVKDIEWSYLMLFQYPQELWQFRGVIPKNSDGYRRASAAHNEYVRSLGISCD